MLHHTRGGEAVEGEKGVAQGHIASQQPLVQDDHQHGRPVMGGIADTDHGDEGSGGSNKKPNIEVSSDALIPEVTHTLEVAASNQAADMTSHIHPSQTLRVLDSSDPLPTTATQHLPLTSQDALSVHSEQNIIIQDPPELFDSPALVPRIGGWIVPRPPPDATEPDLVVPIGAPDDPDDRPLLSQQGGSTAAGSSCFRDRPWIAELRAREEQERQRVKDEEAADTNKEPSPPSASAPPTCNLSYASWGNLSLPEARMRILEALEEPSCPIPSFLKKEVEHFISIASAPLPKKTPRRLPPPEEALPNLNERPLWALQLVQGPLDDGPASVRSSSLLLACSVATRTFDVVAVPALLAAGMHAGQPMSPIWYESKEGRGKRKRSDSGSFKKPKLTEETSTEQQPEASVSVSVPPQAAPLPETEAVQLLQASLLSTTKERDELRTANRRLEDRLASERSAVEALTEQATLVRSLYDQASHAAREALSESSLANERIEKLTRQLHDGLSAHSERFRLGKEHWKEEERQLREQLGLVRASFGREERAEMRKRVNEWRAWMAGEEERRRRKREKEERERREWERERRAELMALREEEEEALARDEEGVLQEELAALAAEEEEEEEEEAGRLEAGLPHRMEVVTSGPFASVLTDPTSSSSSSPPATSSSSFHHPHRLRNHDVGLADSERQRAATASLLASQSLEASRLLREARLREREQVGGGGAEEDRISAMQDDVDDGDYGDRSRHHRRDHMTTLNGRSRAYLQRRDRPPPDEEDLARLAMMIQPPPSHAPPNTNINGSSSSHHHHHGHGGEGHDGDDGGDIDDLSMSIHLHPSSSASALLHSNLRLEEEFEMFEGRSQQERELEREEDFFRDHRRHGEGEGVGVGEGSVEDSHMRNGDVNGTMLNGSLHEREEGEGEGGDIQEQSAGIDVDEFLVSGVTDNVVNGTS